MSVVITVLSDEGNVSLGAFPISMVSITGDTSYPTGGYTPTLGFTAANLNCGRGINGLILAGWNTAAEGYLAVYNTQSGNLQIFTGTAGTPAGTISAPTITTLTNASTAAPVYVTGGALTQATGATGITGVQAPVFTGTPGAAGALAELANATNVSTFTWTFMAIGQR